MRYKVECQVNAQDDRRTVTVEASSQQAAWQQAEAQVRAQQGIDPQVRGCIVVKITVDNR